MGLFSVDDLDSRDANCRNSDCEDLMRQIKALNDKLQKSTEALKREESEKHYEQMIIKKTHETQLEIKNSLVQNLGDIIDEQEARLFHLQSHVNGIGPLSPKISKQLGGVTRLCDEIEQLTNKNVELNEKLLREQRLTQKLSDELANLRSSNGHSAGEDDLFETSECHEKFHQLEKDKAALKSEAETLRHKLDGVETELQCLRIEYERLDIKSSEQSLHADRQLDELRKELSVEKDKYNKEIASLKRNIEDSKHDQCKAEQEQTEVKLRHTTDALMNAENENRTLRTTVDNFDLVSKRHQGELQRWKEVANEFEKELKAKTDDVKGITDKYDQEIDRLKQAMSRIRRETLGWQQRHTDAIIALDCFRASLKSLRVEYADIGRLASTLPAQLEVQLSDVKNQICDVVVGATSELASRYKCEMALRKLYHNQLVELKGNIRVFARIRPIIPADVEQLSVVELDDHDDMLLHVCNNGRKQTFHLDKVFGPRHCQHDVFSEVRPLVTSVLDGYSVCIFAYGQTGSGKTYTMEGTPDNPGINQHALSELFHEMSNRSDWRFNISVSMLEIYNEAIHDLLCDGPDTEKLDIKLNSDGCLYVPGLTSIAVETLTQVNQVFELGRENRATASTNLNEHSSRSHALLCVNVVGQHQSTGAKIQGRLNLVDLAGSERVSKSAACGDRLKEAQCINKSLSALGDVIWALKNQHQHIPFRNSKLTYLLQDSLAGNSKTLMVVQVAPVVSHVGETVCSLNFAHRVRCVELGQATASRTPAATNGSNNHEEATTNVGSPFLRTPSKNYKARNGFKR